MALWVRWRSWRGDFLRDDFFGCLGVVEERRMGLRGLRRLAGTRVLWPRGRKRVRS